MRTCPTRSCLLVWMVLSALPGYVLARQDVRSQLRTTLQRLSAQADPSGQVGTLQRWLRQWRQGGYPNDSTYVNGLLQLGLAHHANNQLETATQVVRQAVWLCRMPRPDISPDQPSKALYRLGTLLTDQSRPAMNILKEAVRRGQGIRSADRWVGAAYLYLASAHYSAGDFQQAIHSAESGEQVVRYTNDRSLMTKLLLEKVKALDVLEQYGAARLAAERAVFLAEQDGYPAMIARAYQLLGVVAENQRQLADALRYRRRAFEIARKNDDFSAPNYAVSVGRLYYQLRQYNQAISYFQYGLDNNTNAYAKAYALNMLGQVCWQKEQYAGALRYYQRGLMMMPVGVRDSALTNLPNPEAIRFADQKDYLLTLVQNKADAWLDSARVANSGRCRREALKAFNVADRMIDYMRWDHTAQESKLYWRQKTRGTYERAIETCCRLGDTEGAFRFFEKSRAVMLADKINELGARQQLPRAQMEQEAALRRAVSEQQNLLAGIAPDSSAYKPAQTALFARQEALDAFLKQLEATNPAYYRYKYDNKTPSLADLQRYLRRRNASFVTYFVGDSALYLLGVTADKATLRRQSIGHYAQDTQEFMALLADPDALNRTAKLARFKALGNGLYRQLLAPLNLPDGAVISSPDGSFVPFETLSSSPTELVYLLDKYAFSYVYSARLVLRSHAEQARTASVAQRDFLGVAPVSFARRLGQVSLPGSDEALHLIAKRFRSARLLTNRAASRGAFLAQVAGARVVHLFTHATADSTGREPTLYFADSTLQLSDLGSDGLPNAELVVLAACKTGVGANQRGEGVFSLARGFAALGASSILTTLWSVENRATYDITNLFYAHLDEGLPKDLALQKAKQDWLQTATGTDRLPTAWAGLITVGDTEPLARPIYWPWIAGGLVLLGVAGAGWRLRRKRPTAPVLFLPRTA